MFGIDFYTRNEIVRFAMQEIAQNLIQRAAAVFGKEPDAYQLAGDRFLETGEYEEAFAGHRHLYSLLFGVKQSCFAICIDQIPEDAVS